MRTQDLVTVVAGLTLVLVGGVLITLAWNGAASLDYVQGQFPYLLSGAVPGVAAVVIGVTLLVLGAMRRDAAERAAQLDQLHAAVRDLAALLGPRDHYDPAVTGEYRPRPRPARTEAPATKPAAAATTTRLPPASVGNEAET